MVLTESHMNPLINFSILQKKQKEKTCGSYRKYRICIIYQLYVPKEIFNWIISPLTTSMFWFIDHKHLIITLFDKRKVGVKKHGVQLEIRNIISEMIKGRKIGLKTCVKARFHLKILICMKPFNEIIHIN